MFDPGRARLPVLEKPLQKNCFLLFLPWIHGHSHCRCCALLAYASCVEVPILVDVGVSAGEAGDKERKLGDPEGTVDFGDVATTSHALMQVWAQTHVPVERFTENSDLSTYS